MNITAVIAEYNPFHKGHAYQLQKVKDAGADYIVILMSPDFVQRGEPAMVDKYTRTRMALSCGADLVLELPVRFATGSAEYFAGGAMSILNRLGAITHLSFGCETPDLFLLETVSSILAEEPPSYKDTLAEELKKGATFPEARQKALLKYFSLLPDTETSDLDAGDIAALLSSPNNILAIEYLKAIRSLRSSLQPLPLMRAGSAYHDTVLPADHRNNYPSASALRAHLKDSDLTSLPEGYIPAPALRSLREALSDGVSFPNVYERYSTLLQYDLWAKSPHLSEYLDLSEDLASRIRSVSFDRVRNTEELIEVIKTRQLTAARIRRVLLHAFLNIRKEDARLDVLSDPGRGYVRILGFKKASAPLLHRLKETSSVPLISKNADASSLLSKSDLRSFQQDLHASEIYAYLCGMPGFAGAEMRRSPIVFS